MCLSRDRREDGGGGGYWEGDILGVPELCEVGKGYFGCISSVVTSSEMKGVGGEEGGMYAVCT